VDVEDWFQVENFKAWIPYSTWNICESRVEQNTHRLLDLFDSIDLDASKKLKLDADAPTSIENDNSKLQRTVKTTFFVLGWIAEKLPHLVREVWRRGHEVASHGYSHELCSKMGQIDLKHDLVKSKKLLEDITGSEVYGYRAPSFSISNDTLKIIEDCGYLYDSSYNSFSLHNRYGKVNLNGQPKNGIAIKLSDNFYELPISNLTLPTKIIQNSKFPIQNVQIPLGGGGYFRLIPSPFFNFGVAKILKISGAYLFYMHPWEIDPSQPKVNQAKMSYRFRHYSNLAKTSKKLSNFINDFSDNYFMSCSEYLKEKLHQDSREGN